MRWRIKTKKSKPEKGWFAWYPVKVEDLKKWVWLERVWPSYYSDAGMVWVKYYVDKSERNIVRGW